ncbi:hypothetical protein GCM10007989_07930 [Devosia pacifica]|uniref:Endonuclease/exonuclease/phosphatase domain-containing protein n=1 Tax=Devosia pacifica TaxID=1335967 RepID=A0A918RY67_9HYPH|nr:endonuclease/exonuclease/phosphatase family protein [Devosia pacifica]GHA15566.1 hypothetical protein GCM10007989_07930 [Devosia pacifica]
MIDKREIRGIVTGLAFVVGLIVIAASAPPYLPGQALLQSLRLHLAIGLAVFLPAFLFLAAPWRALGTALLLIASLFHSWSIINTQQQARTLVEGAEFATGFDVLSFNVLISNQNGEAIADMLLERDADVVVLTEGAPVYSEFSRLSQRYPYRAGCVEVATCDLMILSKTELIDVDILSLSSFSPNRTILARTTIDGEPVRLAAVHLTKPYFDWQAQGEAFKLTQFLNQSEGALVLAGDLNAAAWSGNIHRLLLNTGMIPGPEYPATWPTEFGPAGVPIDNIFTRKPAYISRISALPDPLGSNHRGLIARVEIIEGR